MKTTMDLPASLAIRLKTTAARRGKKVKALAEDIFRAALAGVKPRPAVRGKITLPLFPCAAAAPARSMRLKDILAVEQSTQTREDLERLGLPL